MLGDDNVAFLRLHIAVERAVPFAVATYRHAGVAAFAFARGLFEPDVGEIGVVLGGVDATDEDDEHAGVARGVDEGRQALGHLLRGGNVAAILRHQTALRAKVVDHVDHQQRRMRRIDFLGERAERADMRDPFGNGEILLVTHRVLHLYSCGTKPRVQRRQPYIQSETLRQPTRIFRWTKNSQPPKAKYATG